LVAYRCRLKRRLATASFHQDFPPTLEEEEEGESHMYPNLSVRIRNPHLILHRFRILFPVPLLTSLTLRSLKVAQISMPQPPMAATDLISPRIIQKTTVQLAGSQLPDLPEEERSQLSVLKEQFVRKKRRRWNEKLQRKLKH